MGEVIRPDFWRLAQPACEIILVAKLAAGSGWQVWHWNPEYQLGLDLGLPQDSLAEAEDEARTWAKAYKLDWAISPRPISDEGEMA